MKNLLTGAIILTIGIGCSNVEQKFMEKTDEHLAPIAEKKDSVITFHNHSRTDSYFWMRLSDEQKNAKNPDEQTQQVLSYLNAENDYTSKMMAHTKPLQDELYNEMVGRIKQNDQSAPMFDNGYWYYTRYEEGKEYAIYCRKKGSLDAQEEVYLDVNKLAEGKSYYAVSGLSVSPNNKLLAFGEDDISRRIYTIRFLDLTSGEFLDDKIENTTGSGAWAKDNETYFYCTKNEVSLVSEKIWRHQLNVEEDVMVYHEKDPSYYIGVYASKMNKYIIIYNSSTISDDYWLLDANKPKGDFKNFSERRPGLEYDISVADDRIFVKTNKDALNFKLMEVGLDDTSEENWKEVIAHRENVLISGVNVFKNYLVIEERFDAMSHIRVYNRTTKESRYLEFNEAAFVVGLSRNPDYDNDNFRFYYSSLATPPSVYLQSMVSNESELLKQTEVVGGHNSKDYTIERVYVKSRDGVEVPMSIVYKNGFEKDGNQPVFQYAYGSYGSTVDPSFRSSYLTLLNRGFAVAIAHIRGGQINGRTWYEDGKMFNKKNTFNDFVDCSKWLIENKYTSADHLYAYGGSAGGLLMGAIMNQSPETYNGVLSAVPFVDVVNTMLDETIPLTTNEFDEWGNPKNKDSYEYMLSYSPYDQVKKQNYPNVLVTTGYWDSQVQYWEPAKWVAKLRDYKTDDRLLLLYTDMEAGHGGASGRFSAYKEVAMKYAFVLDLENK